MRWTTLLSLIASASVLSACSIETEKVSRDRTATPEASKLYNQASCQFGFEEGDAAPSTTPAPEMTKTFFGKMLDLSRVRALGGASASALWSFMKTDGVDVYRVETKVAKCAMYSSLPYAPSLLQNFWNRNDQRNQTLGLYLNANALGQGMPARPVIAIRVDTNRYTLMHEYMHFLYDRARLEKGFDESVFRVEAKAKIEQFSRLSNREFDEMDLNQKKEYLAALSEVIDIQSTQQENFVFEEMSIEAVLTMASRQGLLKQVTSYDRVNSSAYIRGSYEKAASEYKKFSEALDALKREVEQEPGLKSELALIEKSAGRMRANQEEATTIYSRFGSIQDRGLNVGRGFAVTDSFDHEGEEVHFGCGRHGEPSLLSQIKLPGRR